MGSPIEKQDDGRDRNLLVWLLCHFPLESISLMGLSLSTLRPIYLAKSNKRSFSFHPRKECKGSEEESSEPRSPLIGVICWESLFKVPYKVAFQRIHACFSDHHPPILLHLPCHLKTSVCSRFSTQIETDICPMDFWTQIIQYLQKLPSSDFTHTC